MSIKGKRYIQLGVFLFSLFTVCSYDVFAKDAVSFYMENDSRTLKPNHKTDRHYTSGGKIVFLTQPDWRWLRHFADGVATDSEDSVDTAVGYFLSHNIFTPDRIDEPEKRNDDDRVYAGWLYTGMFAQRATAHQLDHIELSVGVIGPSAKADRVQKCLHKVLNSNYPLGWEDQLADELAVDLTLMQKKRFLDGVFKPTENTDVIAEYGFTVGSVHRHAQAGLTFRYGFNLGNTFGPGRQELPSGISTFRKAESLESGYLFARVAGRAVEHNRFLTGLDEEPLVGQLQVGAVYRYKKFELGYSQTFLTQEFEEQSGVDSIGAVTLSWQF